MFHFNILGLLFFSLLSTQVFAQTSEEVAPPMKQVIYKSTFVSYVSWLEIMDLTKDDVKAQDFAQFYGAAIGMTRERFWKGNWGHRGEVMALYGQANGGGSQNAVPYQKLREPWMGATISYRGSYRLTPQMTVSMGPVVLYRSIKWTNDVAGMDVKSGATLNYGILADLKYRLSGRWELRQSIGALASKATTIWALSVGYHY